MCHAGFTLFYTFGIYKIKLFFKLFNEIVDIIIYL